MAKATFLFAHGAGADSNSKFMQVMAKLIANDCIEVVCFDFPYMQRRKATGVKSPPDRMPKLQESFIEQIGSIQTENLFIGGKSMGGRVATLIANEVNPCGVVCFGYPFHPPGKPEKTRTEHLQQYSVPTLILQGTRDTFGKPDEVSNYSLSKSIKMQWIQDGDHSLTTLKRSQLTTEQAWKDAAFSAQAFILKHLK